MVSKRYLSVTFKSSSLLLFSTLCVSLCFFFPVLLELLLFLEIVGNSLSLSYRLCLIVSFFVSEDVLTSSSTSFLHYEIFNVLAAALRDSLFILSHSLSFVKYFFSVLSISLHSRAPPLRQLIYITKLASLCQLLFFTFFRASQLPADSLIRLPPFLSFVNCFFPFSCVSH